MTPSPTLLKVAQRQVQIVNLSDDLELFFTDLKFLKLLKTTLLEELNLGINEEENIKAILELNLNS